VRHIPLCFAILVFASGDSPFHSIIHCIPYINSISQLVHSISCLRAQAPTSLRIRRWCFLAAGTACLLGGCNPFHMRLGDIRRVRAALFRKERRHCALSASLWVSGRPPHVSGVCSFPGVLNSLCPPPPNFAFDTRTHLASHAVRRVRAASFRSERRHCALSASLWVSRRPPHVSGVCSFPGVLNSLCPPPPNFAFDT
jgi:hypothetical protein